MVALMRMVQIPLYPFYRWSILSRNLSNKRVRDVLDMCLWLLPRGDNGPNMVSPEQPRLARISKKVAHNAT